MMKIYSMKRECVSALIKISFIFLLFALGGCGGADRDPDETDAREVNTTITASGGFLDWSSDDNKIKARLTVPEGSLDSDTTISVQTSTETGDGVRIIPGTVLDFGPDGLLFNTPATLVIEYDPALLDGIPESALGIYKLSDGKWSALESSVDIDAHIITATVNGFSTFGVGAESVPPVTTASPVGGNYDSKALPTVTLSCSDDGSGCDKTYYTLDGSDPTTDSNEYSSPISISATGTLKYFSTDVAGNAEVVKNERYTIVPVYTIGGTVSGDTLSDWLWLDLNGVAEVSVSQLGTFVFPTVHTSGYQYNVTVKTSPAGQLCEVVGNSGTGTVGTQDVSSVSVNCSNTSTINYNIGGNVTGLSGTVVLTVNGGNAYSVSQNATYSFPTLFNDGITYTVAIQSEPAGQDCVVSNATGKINSGNVTNVDVTCVNKTLTGKVAVFGDRSGSKIADFLDGRGVNAENFIGNEEAINPLIDGDYFAWLENRDGKYDIYVYQISTGEETRATTEFQSQPWVFPVRGPHAFHNGILVWEDYRNGDPDGDVYAYNVVTKTEIPLATGPSDQRDPRVHGDYIVWVDDSSGNDDIYLYQISTETEIALSTTGTNLKPEIYGDYVAWATKGTAGGSKWYIRAYQISTQTLFMASVPLNNRPLNVNLNDQYIVWQDYRNSGVPDIYGYPLDAGTTGSDFPIVTQSSTQQRPRIYGNTAVWIDARNGAGNPDDYYAVLSYDSQSGVDIQEFQFLPPASASGDAFYVEDDGYFVWPDDRSGTTSLYGWNVFAQVETLLIGDVSNKKNFHIDGDNLVWIDTRDGLFSKHIYRGEITAQTESRLTPDRNDYVDLVNNIANYDVVVFGDGGGCEQVQYLIDQLDTNGVNMLAIGTLPDSGGLTCGLSGNYFGLYTSDGPWMDIPPGSPMEIDTTLIGSSHAIFNGIDTTSTISLETDSALIEESIIFGLNSGHPNAPDSFTVLATLGPNMQKTKDYNNGFLPPFFDGANSIIEMTTTNGTTIIFDGSTPSTNLYDHWNTTRWDLLFNEVVYLVP